MWPQFCCYTAAVESMWPQFCCYTAAVESMWPQFCCYTAAVESMWPQFCCYTAAVESMWPQFCCYTAAVESMWPQFCCYTAAVESMWPQFCCYTAAVESMWPQFCCYTAAVESMWPQFCCYTAAVAEHELLQPYHVTGCAAQLGGQCWETHQRHVRTTTWQTPHHLCGWHEHATGKNCSWQKISGGNEKQWPLSRTVCNVGIRSDLVTCKFNACLGNSWRTPTSLKSFQAKRRQAELFWGVLR